MNKSDEVKVTLELFILFSIAMRCHLKGHLVHQDKNLNTVFYAGTFD